MKFKSGVLVLALVCSSIGSQAMTLGRVRGAPLIGQPLDVSVQVQFDAEETLPPLCAEADVFHADTRQDASRVRITVEPAATAQTALVRIQSAQPVDEPMVTVYLKAGCTQKITRKYVLLADYPSELATLPVIAPLVAGASGSRPASGGGNGPASSGATNGTGSGAATAETQLGSTWAEVPRSESAPVKPQPAKPVVRKVRPPVAVPAAKEAVASEKPPDKPADKVSEKTVVEKRQAGRTAGQSRLRLDPLEMLAERVTTLESIKPPAAPVLGDDVVRDAMRMQSLEGDVKALLALAAKNEASLADMKSRLQQAESERFANWLVYALIAAVLACLAAVWTLWSRQKALLRGQSGDWWRGGDSVVARDTRDNAATPVQPGPVPPPAVVLPQVAVATPDIFRREAHVAGALSEPAPMDHDPVSQVDLHLSEISASTFDTLLQAGPSSYRGSKPGTLSRASGVGARRINSEAAFDIRQQADFFVSLGQTDQAIRVLENHIAENAGSSPSLYLDLLRLFHQLNLKTDYRQFREDFNLLFRSRVPEFALFTQAGNTLEAYPDVLSDITSLWASPQVLQLLEACIFQNAWEDKEQVFDLAAFRELLLLHAVAQSEHEGAPATEPPSDYARFTPMPTIEATLSGHGSEKLEQDTDLQTYSTRSDSLPSIYSEVDLDLDFDMDSINSPLKPDPPK